MSKLARFATDRRGTTFEGVALSVAIVAVAFVASADMLDYMMKKHVEGSRSIPVASAPLDMTPTGSLAQTRPILDPCTGQLKNRD